VALSAPMNADEAPGSRIAVGHAYVLERCDVMWYDMKQRDDYRCCFGYELSS
jgi:hypothetical protein